ncbi:hypothetical protein JDV02_006452 [Purpureocillium takamizusanense]|uniref:Uncharacterized protein n=1 Tax=Purpureocillium takamizusanense TaxID=2060973 RepID=A0A9Q8VC50_9HYPO|nr:uncharacterized protein JDV02_006452 [Purpureocillium takamizusanense]UNI20358.1 hypothetical protein JDV02_006452 [Purpureocillium takamizusanense]
MHLPTAHILAAALLAVTPLADAYTCRPNRVYCGYHLVAGGVTTAQLSKAVERSASGKDGNDPEQMLFLCGSGGKIRFKKECPTKCEICPGAVGDHCS